VNGKGSARDSRSSSEKTTSVVSTTGCKRQAGPKPSTEYQFWYRQQKAGVFFSIHVPVMAQRKATGEARVSTILHPDTSRRLSFPSLGDPLRPELKHEDFQEKTGLSFPSMKPDGKAEKRFQAAHKAWELEQGRENEVMEERIARKGLDVNMRDG